MKNLNCETCGLTIELLTNRIENTRFSNQTEDKFEYVKFDLCDVCYSIVSKKMVKKIMELKTYYKN